MASNWGFSAMIGSSNIQCKIDICFASSLKILKVTKVVNFFASYFMARYRKLTTCPRVQGLAGAKVVAVLPAVIWGVWFTAQSMAS